MLCGPKDAVLEEDLSDVTRDESGPDFPENVEKHDGPAFFQEGNEPPQFPFGGNVLKPLKSCHTFIRCLFPLVGPHLDCVVSVPRWSTARHASNSEKEGQ